MTKPKTISKHPKRNQNRITKALIAVAILTLIALCTRSNTPPQQQKTNTKPPQTEKNNYF